MPRKPTPKPKPARASRVQPLSTDSKVLADFRRSTAAVPAATRKQKRP